MGSEWPLVTIEEIAAEIPHAMSTGPFGSAISSKYFVEDGVPVIRGSNLSQSTDMRLSDEKLVFISDEKAAEFKRSRVRINDLIFTCWGTINQVGFLDGTSGWDEYIISNKQMKLTVNTEIADPKYVYYLFSSPLKQQEILSNGIGAAVPGFNLGQLKKHTLKLPPLSTQKSISFLLDLLDKKIQLNRQTNQTLEQMAQALFKSWFVDFDPVIDKVLAAGNPIPDEMQDRAQRRQQQLSNPDHKPLPDNIMQLFPSEFEITDELGWVPLGWEVQPLDKVAHFQNGLALQKFRPANEDEFLPVLKIAHLKQGFTDGKEKASLHIKASCIVDDGDVVFSWSGSLMVDVWCGGKAALNQHLFRVTSDIYPRWLYYHYTVQHLSEFQRIAADKAVTMGHIKREHLSQAMCTFPVNTLLEKIGSVIEPCLEKIVQCRKESNQLEKLRDTLLPKLISGELRVASAENV